MSKRWISATAMALLMGVNMTTHAQEAAIQHCPAVDDVRRAGANFEAPLKDVPGYWRADSVTPMRGSVTSFHDATAVAVYGGVHFYACAYKTDQSDVLKILYQPDDELGGIVKFLPGDTHWRKVETNAAPRFVCQADAPEKCAFTPVPRS
ncbi:hypothetical protein PAQ31011_03518 [Pandoraea aquatica]|uniref:DUF3757 domain-containing protein n=1 Tax=Pandoraea aquatica TaxID=2508290 RepID=A0A5E4WYG0_9BURK|nr:DUF3757 domain-containing protein [Pandoraea aquatica]VVE28076.1 hypothetical protein PAQ31011_03518 [Pandoraea aquatica]